jgi:hypothetical protein
MNSFLRPQPSLGIARLQRLRVLDLKDLILAGQEAISFLDRCEADGITLMNYAAYVRGSRESDAEVSTPSSSIIGN